MEKGATESENGHLREFKHSLETEYIQLHKESLEIAALLRQARQKKRILQAEVKFLRQRAELLEEVSSETGPTSAANQVTSSTELEDSEHHLVQLNNASLKPQSNSLECFFVATNTNFIDLEEDE